MLHCFFPLLLSYEVQDPEVREGLGLLLGLGFRVSRD